MGKFEWPFGIVGDPNTQANQDALKLYLDSLQAGTGASGAAGGDLTGTYPNPQVAQLTEDEVKIAPVTELTWMETYASYANAILAADPIGFWQLDEASGTDWADSSGNGKNLTTVDAALTHAEPPLTSGGVHSLAGTHFSLERVGDPTFGNFGTESFSIEFWYQPDDYGEREEIAGNWSGHGWVVEQIPDAGSGGQIKFSRGTGGGAPFTMDVVADGLVANTKIYVVCVFDKDAGALRIYIDGVLAAETLSVDPTHILDGGDFMLGQVSFTGVTHVRHLDDVALYDRALAADEAAGHHAVGAGASTISVGFALQHPENGVLDFHLLNELRIHGVPVLLDAPLGQSDVNAFSYSNGWTDNGIDWTGYYKDSFGIVHFQGESQQHGGTGSTTIVTLPAGFRPAGRRELLMRGFAGPSGERTLPVRVNTDGTVDAQLSSADLDSLGWCGSFLAGA